MMSSGLLYLTSLHDEQWTTLPQQVIMDACVVYACIGHTGLRCMLCRCVYVVCDVVCVSGHTGLRCRCVYVCEYVYVYLDIQV